MTQEELNSFLAVEEDLQVKGLTQNQAGSTEPKQESYSPPPKKHQQLKYTTRPPDREVVPTTKPSRPPPDTTNYTEDTDEIQEIVPVKSEPSDPLRPPNIQHQPTSVVPDQPPALYTTQALATTEGQDMVYQEENYEDYEQYETEQYNATGMEDVNKGMNCLI